MRHKKNSIKKFTVSSFAFAAFFSLSATDKPLFNCIPFCMVGDSHNNFYSSISYLEKKQTSRESMEMSWMTDFVETIPEKAKGEIDALRLHNARLDINLQLKINLFLKLKDLSLDNTLSSSLSFDSFTCSMLTKLSVVRCSIKSLKGIGKLSNLIRLDARRNNIVDITPLNENRHLRLLYLTHNKIEDPEPLVEILSQLTECSLEGNPLKKEKLEVVIDACKQGDVHTEETEALLDNLFTIKEQIILKQLNEQKNNLQQIVQKKEDLEKKIMQLKQQYNKINYY